MLERCERIAKFIESGKAAKRVTPDVRAALPQLDWRGICGMRDVLIHDYIGVDLDEVWNVAFNHLPQLRDSLFHFLSQDSRS